MSSPSVDVVFRLIHNAGLEIFSPKFGPAAAELRAPLLESASHPDTSLCPTKLGHSPYVHTHHCFNKSYSLNRRPSSAFAIIQQQTNFGSSSVVHLKTNFGSLERKMQASMISTRATFNGNMSLKQTPLRRAHLPCRFRQNRFTVLAFKDGEKPYKTPPTEDRIIPAFSRRRERTVGRLAMLGVAAAWAGEVLTGFGPLTQLSNEVGVPMPWIYFGTFSLAGLQLMLGLNQFNATWTNENQRDVDRRTKGITGIKAIEPDVEERIQPTKEPGKFILRNELVLGRAAMLIFAGACILEYVWHGQSPLAHAGLITPGTSLSASPIWLKAGIVLFALGGFGVLSGFDTRKDADTY